MLATLNLVRKYNHKYTLKKYTFLYQELLNFEGASIFCKGLAFCSKNSNYSKQQYQSCTEFSSVFSSVFENENITFKKIVSFTDFRIVLNQPYQPLVRKIIVNSKFTVRTFFSIFYNVAVCHLPSLVTGQRFHVNIIAGTGVMKILVYKR